MTRLDGKLTKGLEVHAHLLAQLLDGKIPAVVAGWSLWLVAIAVVIAGGLTSLLEMRSWKLAVVLTGPVAFFVSLPFLLPANHIDQPGLPAFRRAVGWLFAFPADGGG